MFFIFTDLIKLNSFLNAYLPFYLLSSGLSEKLLYHTVLAADGKGWAKMWMLQKCDSFSTSCSQGHFLVLGIRVIKSLNIFILHLKWSNTSVVPVTLQVVNSVLDFFYLFIFFCFYWCWQYADINCPCSERGKLCHWSLLFGHCRFKNTTKILNVVQQNITMAKGLNLVLAERNDGAFNSCVQANIFIFYFFFGVMIFSDKTKGCP